MSDDDVKEQVAQPQHRGFNIKAREVLLEPPAPFAVVSEGTGSANDHPSGSRSHRGFTAKARDVLLDRQTHGNPHYSQKSILFDLGKGHNKQQSQLHSNFEISDKPIMQQTSTGYEKKEILVPHSKLSRIKAHKLLGETGKTRSANEIFYDQCVKRVRNPLTCYSIDTKSLWHEDFTAPCSDSQRISTSDDEKMADYTTFEKFQKEVKKKGKSAECLE